MQREMELFSENLSFSSQQPFKALVQPKMPTTNIQENNHQGNISLDAYRKPKSQQKNKTEIEINENAESLYYIEIQQEKGKEESNNSDGQRRAQQLLEQQKGFDIQRMKSVINSQYCPFYLRRDKQCGLNYCNPDFYLQSLHKKMVMSSRKSSLTINSQYKIYLCEGDYELMRDGSLLLGKVEGNFFGTEFNIYKLNKSKGMQLQATVAYKAQCNCQSTKVMQVYIKNPSKYDTQVEEQIFRESGRIKSLKDLYFNRNTPDGYVHRLVTKQPRWREDLQCYTQNFKGKSKMSSTKNIILIDEVKPKQNSLLFCKISQERFYCEMGGPLSVLLGMGIIVSMFDFKLLCQ